MLINLRKYKTLKFLNQLNSFMILKMLPLSQTEFIKLKNVLGKYNIEIKIAKTKEFKAFLEKMYKQNIYTNQFNLQFHGQLYILKTKKVTDCLLDNFYKFNKYEESYTLENKNKKFIILSVFYKSFFYKITTLNSICKKREFIKTNSQIILLFKNNLKKLFFFQMLIIRSLIIIKKTSFALTTESYSDVNSLIGSKHAKVNSRNPLVFITKRSVHTSSNRIFLESNKNASVNFKKSLILISKRGIKTSKKKKKSFIKNVDKITLINNTNEKSTHPIVLLFYNIFEGIFKGLVLAILVWVPLCSFALLLIKGIMTDLHWCNYFLDTFFFNSTKHYNSLEYFHSLGPQKPLEELKQLQTNMINSALKSMLLNEFFFEFYPNTISFQSYKIFYLQELKIVLEKLDLERFENPDEALRFISAFYEHYFKIIEFNKDSTISQITTK